MGLFDETATLTAGQDPGDTSTSGIGSLISVSDLYNQALAQANNNKLENFDSFVVTNPDLVDPSIDVSGLRTTTDASILGNIPDYGGIQYEAYNPNRLSDLMRLYSGGFPMLDTPQAAAPVTTAPDTGDGGQATLPIDTIQPIDTPITTDLTDDQINEFATEDTTMPPMLSSDMVGGIDTTPVDTTPPNMSPLADEQFVDTTSGLDDVDMNLIDQPFADTPVVLGSGNNALGLEDPTSLAIGPDGAVDFNTGGLDDITNIPETTLTSAQAPVEQAPPGIMNPYDPSQSTVLGQPGIDRLDTSEVDIPDNYFTDDSSTNIEDIPVELPTTNIETAIEPQAVNTILGPDGITYDAVTGNPIYEDLDAQAAATTLELNQIQDQPLRNKLSSSLTSATEGLSSVAELTGDKLREIGTNIAGAVGGVFKPDGSTITVPGLGEINVKKTIGGMILNKVVGGPVTLVFSAVKALAGLLPKESLENSTTRSIASQLTAENDYGYNMGNNSIGQDPFGRNPVSQFGNYEQTLAEDAASTSTTKMGLAKKQYAEDYFNAKAEVAGGVEVDDGTVLGPGEFLPESEDLVSLEDQLKSQPVTVEEISPGYSPDDDDPADDGPEPSAPSAPSAPTAPSNPYSGGEGGVQSGMDTSSAPQQATETASYSNENEYESAAYDPPSQPDYSNVSTGGPPSQGGGGGGPPSQGGGCCFIMLESRYGDGTMDKVVRRYRDEKMTPRNRRGYYKMAVVLVPLMRKSKVFKWIVTKTFADPLVSYGKWYYGENKHGWIFAPVKTAWLKIFDVVGTDTVFIRENGEEV